MKLNPLHIRVIFDAYHFSDARYRKEPRQNFRLARLFREQEGNRYCLLNPQDLAAAANWGAVEANVAAATIFDAAGDCCTAGLDHLAAGFVAAGAGDAAAVFGEFTLAEATSQLAVKDGDAVELAADRALASGQRATEVLQSCTGNFVFT